MMARPIHSAAPTPILTVNCDTKNRDSRVAGIVERQRGRPQIRSAGDADESIAHRFVLEQHEHQNHQHDARGLERHPHRRQHLLEDLQRDSSAGRAIPRGWGPAPPASAAGAAATAGCSARSPDDPPRLGIDRIQAGRRSTHSASPICREWCVRIAADLPPCAPPARRSPLRTSRTAPQTPAPRPAPRRSRRRPDAAAHAPAGEINKLRMTASVTGTSTSRAKYRIASIVPVATMPLARSRRECAGGGVGHSPAGCVRIGFSWPASARAGPRPRSGACARTGSGSFRIRTASPRRSSENRHWRAYRPR